MTKIKDLLKKRHRNITIETVPEVVPKPTVVLRMTVAEVKPESKKKKEPSQLQKLGNDRNWRVLQAKGAIGHLQHLRQELSTNYIFQYVYQNGLQVILDELLKAIDKKWEEDKRAYHLRVEEEAFAAYPRSFRGSPAEINKRLDIMQAQREF